MAAAETARLIASLELQDKFSGTAAKAEASMGRLNTASNKVGLAGWKVTKGLTGASKAAGGFGGAMSKAGTAAGGFARSLGPMLGVGGLLGVGALFASSISKAEEFGATVSKVGALTGLSTETTSAYVDTLDKFGIGADRIVKVTGILEKNLGALTSTAKKAAAFQTAYGIAITDTNGKALSANEILLNAADLFKSNASATTKATALNKLYGKSWQDLIPVLSLGRKGLKAELAEGLQLSKEELASIAKFRIAQRDFADTFGDLQVKVGANLLGALIGPLKEFTTFLDTHQNDVVGFFKGVVGTVKDIGGAIGSLAPVAKAIGDAWNAIPADFRKLIIGGVALNFASKKLLGFDPIDIVRRSVTGVLTGGVKAAVVNVSGGVVNTPGGLPGAAAKGGGGVGSVLKFAAALGLAAVAVELFENNLAPLANKIGQQERDLTTQTTKFGGTATKADIQSALNFALEQRQKLRGDPVTEALDLFGERSTLDRTIKQLTASLDDFGKRASETGGFKGFEGKGIGFRPDPLSDANAAKFGRPIVRVLDVLHQDFLAQRALLKEGTDAQKAAAAKAIVGDAQKGVGNVKTTAQAIAELKSARLTVHDPESQRVIDSAIASLEGKLNSREWIATQKAAAAKIVASNKSTADKVSELKGIQRDLIAHGDSAAARIVGGLLAVQTEIRLKQFIATSANPSLPPLLPTSPRRHPGPTYVDAGGGIGGGRASGGPVKAGTTYMVGEKGPEWFVPKEHGQILSHRAQGRRPDDRADFGWPRRASGFFGMTTRQTDLGDIGIAGEISNEAVAVVKNPKPIAKQTTTASRVFVTNWPKAATEMSTKATEPSKDSTPPVAKDTPQVRGAAFWRTAVSKLEKYVETYEHVKRLSSRQQTALATDRKTLARDRERLSYFAPVTINLRATTSHRDNATAKVIHNRYGPTRGEVGAV